jgi:hypothetical protein
VLRSSWAAGAEIAVLERFEVLASLPGPALQEQKRTVARASALQFAGALLCIEVLSLPVLSPMEELMELSGMSPEEHERLERLLGVERPARLVALLPIGRPAYAQVQQAVSSDGITLYFTRRSRRMTLAGRLRWCRMRLRPSLRLRACCTPSLCPRSRAPTPFAVGAAAWRPSVSADVVRSSKAAYSEECPARPAKPSSPEGGAVEEPLFPFFSEGDERERQHRLDCGMPLPDEGDPEVIWLSSQAKTGVRERLERRAR